MAKTTYHYSAQIVDFEAGTVTVTERVCEAPGGFAISGDAVCQVAERLTDEQIETWLGEVAFEEWATPDGRDHDDLTITTVRA